jgi:hypothetical protein
MPMLDLPTTESPPVASVRAVAENTGIVQNVQNTRVDQIVQKPPFVLGNPFVVGNHPFVEDPFVVGNPFVVVNHPFVEDPFAGENLPAVENAPVVESMSVLDWAPFGYAALIPAMDPVDRVIHACAVSMFSASRSSCELQPNRNRSMQATANRNRSVIVCTNRIHYRLSSRNHETIEKKRSVIWNFSLKKKKRVPFSTNSCRNPAKR